MTPDDPMVERMREDLNPLAPARGVLVTLGAALVLYLAIAALMCAVVWLRG